MVAWATMFLMAEPGRILFDYSTAPRKNDRKSSSNTTVVINGEDPVPLEDEGENRDGHTHHRRGNQCQQPNRNDRLSAPGANPEKNISDRMRKLCMRRCQERQLIGGSETLRMLNKHDDDTDNNKNETHPNPDPQKRADDELHFADTAVGERRVKRLNAQRIVHPRNPFSNIWKETQINTTMNASRIVEL